MNPNLKISQDSETGTYTVSYRCNPGGIICTGRTPKEAANKFLEFLLWRQVAICLSDKKEVEHLLKCPFFLHNEVCHYFGIQSEISDKTMHQMEVISNQETGVVYFKDLPYIIAEGETYEEAKRNLYELAKFHFANP